ncbi:MAG: ATP-binding cassette domain-containing protein [Pleurocapsa sp.]
MLRLENVSLQATLGSDFLLQNVSCDFKQGEKIGIIGTSGSGKTSLLRLLNRLVSPSDGTIHFLDCLQKELTTIKLRQSIVLVPQEPKLLGMVVIDALAYPLRLQSLAESEIRQRIDTWLGLLHIEEQWLNKTELQLSLGQRQLAAIARALIMQPQILLLDEPTSALDVGTATHVLQVLEDLNQNQNMTIVMVNHQLELIEHFCDRLLFLNRGELEENLKANDVNWKTLKQKLMTSHLAQEQEWD